LACQSKTAVEEGYAINRIIDRLQLLGWITVEIDPADERARRIERVDVERVDVERVDIERISRYMTACYYRLLAAVTHPYIHGV
jgi:hypothetical protein